MIKIFEFTRPTVVINSELRDRAERSKQRRSRQFLALVNKHEGGYLSYDDRSDIGTGVVYEVFVLPEFRRQGIGHLLIRTAEVVARSLKCNRIRLLPSPFDHTIAPTYLNNWYTRMGYRPTNDGTHEIEKIINEHKE
jgi:GNAT superfamily N-acetyltransferase